MAFAGSVTIYPPVVSEGAEALGASLISVLAENTAVSGLRQVFFQGGRAHSVKGEVWPDLPACRLAQRFTSGFFE
jgi:hypothetical protein